MATITPGELPLRYGRDREPARGAWLMASPGVAGGASL